MSVLEERFAAVRSWNRLRAALAAPAGSAEPGERRTAGHAAERLCGRAAVLAALGVCLQCNSKRGSWVLLLVPQLPMPAREAEESAGLADAGRAITPPSGPAKKPPPRVAVVPAQRTKTWPLNLGRGMRSPQSLPWV